MRYIVTAITLLLFSKISFSQSVRPEIAQLAKEIAESNWITDAALGEEGVESKVYKTYETLCKSAIDSELLHLANDQNPAVKGYAFQCLYERDTKTDLFKVLLANIMDSSVVRIQYGCMRDHLYVVDFFINMLYVDYTTAYTFKSHGGNSLNSAQVKILDSVLIFGKVPAFHAKEELIKRLKPEPKYYDALREMAIVQNYPIAALKLASYNKKEDIPVIKKFLLDTIYPNGLDSKQYYGLLAVQRMPDPEFFPALKRVYEVALADTEYFDFKHWPEICEALALYPTRETYQLFEQGLTLNNPYFKEIIAKHIYKAIGEHPDPIFSPLVAK